MENVEIVLTVRRRENDGSYTEWQTKPGSTAFTAIVKKEIKKLLGGGLLPSSKRKSRNYWEVGYCHRQKGNQETIGR